MSTAEELARLRIEKEAKKVISTTNQMRKLKQRELVGEVQDIHVRKDLVEDAKKVWSTKGTEGRAHGSDTIEEHIATKAKQAYEENLRKFGEKGQPEPTAVCKGTVPEDLKKKFDKPASNLFSRYSIMQTKESIPSKRTANSDGFAKIEKQEEKMAGTARHITTTGVDSAGRRVTKTKIILPEQVGETKAQQQQIPNCSSSSAAESNNQLMTTNCDGKYYSLADIRQRKVDGIDKNNREQYLSPEDFEHTFNMSKDEFSKLPKWKRDNLKRDLHLF